MNSPDRVQWRTAIEEELWNMNHIAPLLTGQHVFGGSWVFVKKAATQSSTACFKAWGNRQAENKFELTFAPTSTFTSLRMLLTIVSLHKWYINSFDFVTAYLNADIKEDIWVRPPDGLAVPPGYGCKLWKALYGTKQARNCVAGPRYADANKTSTSGLRVQSEPELPDTIHYQHNMGRHTSNEDTPPSEVQPNNTLQEQKCGTAEGVHWGSGALSYVAVGTRPDIAYSVNLLAQQAACPGLTHWQCLQNLLGYLAHMTNMCLTL
ncbi:hypothetical protein O181_027971 [Austropuccinia psidii MF-1]|uniref:Reverse transcriptase Ty1/copia-type domain-containing protein n=1 Tax=Austropuccinia psidii MF-1 TaxID=1389203 RepID=A0A9Q3CTJ6_9BASI|nr:hypothetical protein [Austropuccinia psidii MF-1]